MAVISHAVLSQNMDNFNLAVNTHVDPRRAEAVPVGADRQLLVDDFFLAMGRGHEQYPRNIAWTLGSVDKHGAPLFEGQQPWEDSSAWLTVLKDGGRYRMWYNTYHPEARRGLFLSYAESDDGVEFTRRELGLVEVAGSTRNNVVFDGGLAGISPESGNVFIDPNALDGERYKLIYTDWWGPGGPRAAVHAQRGHAARRRFARRPLLDPLLRQLPGQVLRLAEQRLLGPDPGPLRRLSPRHRRARVAVRRRREHPRRGTRARGRPPGVGRLPHLGEHRHRAAGRLPRHHGYRHLQQRLRAVSVLAQRALHVPVLLPPLRGDLRGAGLHQPRQPQLVPPNRDTFVPLGEPGEYDCFIVSIAPGFVAIDDDTLALYYRSGDGPHGGSKPIELGYQSRSRVSRVTFKRDRIIGIEAGSERGQFITRPLTFTGSQLQVNLEALGPEAELTAQLVSVESGEPIEGFGFDDCRPLRADALDGVIGWGGRDRLPAELAGRPVRLHVRLRSARLYAFQFAA